MNMSFLVNHTNAVVLYYFFFISTFAAVLWHCLLKLLSMGMLSHLPSQSAIFSTYASISGSIMMVRSIAKEVIPSALQAKFRSYFDKLFKPLSAIQPLTFVITEYHNGGRNEVFDASESYLRTKIAPSVDKVQIFKRPRDKNAAVAVHKGEYITDVFEGIPLKWQLISGKKKTKNIDSDEEHSSFHLQIPKKHYDRVMKAYIPFILSTVKARKKEKKIIHFQRLNTGEPAVIFEHPANFSTLAMDEKMKTEIIEDLERFIRMKEFYKRVGRAWKRGYLLYGPPGTGKSTLIAAIANHLKFDVYDLELSKISQGGDLRRCLRGVNNQSILVFEDIDCTVTLHDCKDEVENQLNQLTLSEVLNTIDGLWSSCGDERIIIFTTNHKDCLDPAMLRPGRMDVHIHMSYCTADAFSTLASTYLGIPKNDKNRLFLEAKDWISKCQVTAAQVAEQLMKSEDADIALEGLLEFLKQWKIEDKDDLEAKEGSRSDSVGVKKPE